MLEPLAFLDFLDFPALLDTLARALYSQVFQKARQDCLAAEDHLVLLDSLDKEVMTETVTVVVGNHRVNPVSLDPLVSAVSPGALETRENKETSAPPDSLAQWDLQVDLVREASLGGRGKRGSHLTVPLGRQ